MNIHFYNKNDNVHNKTVSVYVDEVVVHQNQIPVGSDGDDDDDDFHMINEAQHCVVDPMLVCNTYD
jgi:hypothetical protein